MTRLRSLLKESKEWWGSTHTPSLLPARLGACGAVLESSSSRSLSGCYSALGGTVTIGQMGEFHVGQMADAYLILLADGREGLRNLCRVALVAT